MLIQVFSGILVDQSTLSIQTIFKIVKCSNVA